MSAAGVDAAAEAVAWLDEAARERLGAERLTAGMYAECPGCALVVHREDRTAHAGRCTALRALVTWEAMRHRGADTEAQSADRAMAVAVDAMGLAPEEGAGEVPEVSNG